MSQTVIITGSSRGIGRSIALSFAAAGWNVVINGCHNQVALEETKQEIEKLGVNCLSFLGDVGNYEFVSTIIEETKNAFGGVDVLINNAGIASIGLLQDLSPSKWEELLSTNLSSVFYSCKQVIPIMLSQKAGHIINISSVWGQFGASCEVAYSATKGAIDSFTKALAKELAPSNIQVNAISLGMIDTEMNHCFSPEEVAALEEEIPMGRMGTPKEVGDFVFQIATASSYLTGQIIRFDGGWM